MSLIGMSDLFERLPESYQEECILDCLEKMFARGEWHRVLATLSGVEKLNNHTLFKANAMAITVKARLRQRGVNCALTSWEELYESGAGQATRTIAVESLRLIAGQMMPEDVRRIHTLWRRFTNKPMTVAMRRDLIAIGCALSEAYIRGDQADREREMRHEIEQLRHTPIAPAEQET